jgi:D-alanine-D-alanine ligase
MRVTILVHKDLIPPQNVVESDYDWAKVDWVTEYEVHKCLMALGYDVQILGVSESLQKIRKHVEEFKPHVIFNLLEEFKGEAIFDQNVVSYLELLGVPYTGSNPKGLIIGRDKALSKKILSYHKIKTPRFQVFPRNKPRIKSTIKKYPVIVKCLNEEASLGISQASVVHNEEKMRARVEFIHKKFKTDAIAEEFISGREYFIGVLGNYRLEALPVWELKFEGSDHPEKEFYSTAAKFDVDYRGRKGISTGPADLSDEQAQAIQKLAKRAYKALGLNGYARMDIRLNSDGGIYLLEANPNPDISEFDDFSESAKKAGYTYQSLIEKIIKLGRQWNPTD